MARVDNLNAAMDNLAAQLENMTTNMKPNYMIDGQSVSWQSLFDSITNSMEKLQVQIDIANGPYNADTLGIG